MIESGKSRLRFLLQALGAIVAILIAYEIFQVAHAVMRACGDTKLGCNLATQPFSWTSHGLNIGTNVGPASLPVVYFGHPFPAGLTDPILRVTPPDKLAPFCLSVFRTGQQVHVWRGCRDWNQEESICYKCPAIGPQSIGHCELCGGEVPTFLLHLCHRCAVVNNRCAICGGPLD